jgi:hypothetical protein
MADRRLSVAESAQTVSSDAPYSQTSPAVPNAGHSSFRRYVPASLVVNHSLGERRGKRKKGKERRENSNRLLSFFSRFTAFVFFL